MKTRQKINRELPQVGTKYYKKFKDKHYTAEIIRDDKDKNVRLIEMNGKRYRTMSAAAKVITKDAVNGWRFWKLVK